MTQARHIAALACLLASGAQDGAWAQAGIYTCIDAKGHRLTSDRPIVECIDREQKELTPTGTVKRVLKPTLSAEEQAMEDEKNRKLAEERAHEADERKRDRAMMSRYPDKASHDKERSDALAAVQEVIAAANKRIAELEDQRRKLESETEFYHGDPAKMPPILKRQIDQNQQTLEAQRRFISNQEMEKQRVNQRFDEELAKLQRLWAEQKAAAAARAAKTP
ncbi:MAG TPA: DUF4124 domain-containing protein [Ramlibacter sp.]|uniref:DUF4124 domain-containing protein n=1 Tax=Ramlibacter sp. TaxID=1917967 RepID=UPI002BCFAE72|nr:DUF4124 domain-containing protein [Ramlibacter sp.]HVZ43945.1 DUF4124 domain-containing protein [Ramlibacter sp.]